MHASHHISQPRWFSGVSGRTLSLGFKGGVRVAFIDGVGESRKNPSSAKRSDNTKADEEIVIEYRRLKTKIPKMTATLYPKLVKVDEKGEPNWDEETHGRYAMVVTRTDKAISEDIRRLKRNARVAKGGCLFSTFKD